MSTVELAHVLDGDCTGRAQFTGCSTDSRTVESGQLFVALSGPNFDAHAFAGAACDRGAAALLVARAGDYPVPAVRVDDTRLALGRLAAAWRRRFDLPVAAVTGSNGKTTVKEMLAAILAVEGEVLATAGNLNNDVGLPLTLFRLGPEHRCAVIEMGANHAGEIASLAAIAAPCVGVITQCAPAHLEGFGTVDDVAAAKGELFEQLPADGCAVINADDDYADFWRSLAGQRRSLSFGLCGVADVSATWCREGARTRLVLLTPAGVKEASIALPGRHNVMNALAATAAALALGCSLDTIATGLAGVVPLGGRLHPIKTPDELWVIDDTYNANPESLKAALEVLAQYGGRTWLLLGDMAELGPGACGFHREAGALAREYGVERLYATGERCRLSVEAFGEGGHHFDNQEALIRAVLGSVCRGVTVLVKGSRSMRMERVVDALLKAR